MYELDFSIVIKSLPQLLEGAKITLQLSLASLALGLAIGLVVGILRVLNNKFLYVLTSIYIEAIRCTPLLVQLYIIYFGLPQFGVTLDPFTAGVLGLGIRSGAYVAEIVRGGIQGIPKGQMAAAKALGMKTHQAMLYIILPQAAISFTPALANEFISLILGSSLGSVLSLVELTRVGQQVVARTYRSFEIYIGISIFYFVMTYTLSLFISFFERWTKRAHA